MFLTNPSWFIAVAFFFAMVKAEAEECCAEKVVGSVSYTLLPDAVFDGEIPGQCINNCLYTVTGTSSPKFCFGRGDLPTECLSDMPGILLIGGGPSGYELGSGSGYGSIYGPQSVEFWSDGGNFMEERSCVLSDYPRDMSESSTAWWDLETYSGGATANLVSDKLVACYGDSCDSYCYVCDYCIHCGSWDHLVQTRSTRGGHSSAEQDGRILLIGGIYSNSTEWIPLDGSAAQPGPFNVRHGAHHCTMQLSPDLIVVTGGLGTERFVTEYQMTGNGDERPLTSIIPKSSHACGVYNDAGGQQVLLVTGGISTTELEGEVSRVSEYTQVAVYSHGGELEWRTVDGGSLPMARSGLRATLVDDILYVTGGYYAYRTGEAENENEHFYLKEILAWDPVGETWSPVGMAEVGRDGHAAVAVPRSFFASECAAH